MKNKNASSAIILLMHILITRPIYKEEDYTQLSNPGNGADKLKLAGLSQLWVHTRVKASGGPGFQSSLKEVGLMHTSDSL